MWLRGATTLLGMLTVSSGASAETTVSHTGTFGGPGGGSFELACPAGSVMTGLRARHGAWIDALSPICSVWDGRSQTLREIGNQPFTGGNGGGPGFIRCDVHYGGVLVGIHMYQADNSDGSVGLINVDCGNYRQPAQFANKAGGSVDFLGNSMRGSRAAMHCGPGLVAAGIYGHSGAFIDRLGLLCIRPTN
jgi:hypothetical protein